MVVSLEEALDNLQDLRLEMSPHPTKIRENANGLWDEYEAHAFFGEDYAGIVRIARKLSPFKNPITQEAHLSNDFFFDMSQKPPVPKPFVCWQYTEEGFRHIGVCSFMIYHSNTFFKPILGMPLYSSDHFVLSFQKESKGVWRKLEESGKAIYIPFEGKDRWRML